MRIVSSLQSKIVLSVCAIVALTIGIGTWLNIRYQRAQVEQAVEDNVMIIGNTIGRSLEQAMLQGESKQVQGILEAVGGYHNIAGVRIFSTRGVILKSSNRGLIGRTVDPAEQQWFREGSFDKPIRRRRESVFTVLFPIENRPACRQCHGTVVKLNGILAVDVSLGEAEREIADVTKTMLLWALGVTVVLGLSLSLFLTRFVTSPIEDLIRTMERAERGLEARARVRSRDDIGRLAEAFNSLLSRLERARRKVEKYHFEQMRRADRLASIGEMAAGIAHEIKNPLAGIAGVIQVLRKDLAEGDQNRAVLNEVLSQVERMDKAVRNLLSFARPPEPRLSSVDLNELAARILDFLTPQFAKHHIQVDRRFTPGLPRLTLDPDLMQQAFLNIALNAIQAMPDGGRFAVETLREQAEGTGGAVKILFTDTGPGIPMEELARIFTPFFTTRQQGTGLGLSITQRIIEQHNGDISVRSRPGSGATFIITLPVEGRQIEKEAGSPNHAAEDTGH